MSRAHTSNRTAPSGRALQGAPQTGKCARTKAWKSFHGICARKKRVSRMWRQRSSSGEAGMTQARMYGCTSTERVMSWAMLPTAKGKCMWWAKRPSMLAPWVRLPQQRRNERLPRTSWGAAARQPQLRKQLGRRARGGRRRLVGRMLAADRPASAVPPGGRFVGV